MRAAGSPRARTRALSGLLVLAVLATLFLARDLLLPIVMALILTLVFAPLVRRLNLWRIPEPVGAAAIVIGLIALMGMGAYHVAEPASEWLVQAPQSIRQIGAKLRLISAPVQNMNTASEQMSATTKGLGTADSTKPRVQEVSVQAPTLAGVVIGAAQTFALSAISTLILLYFLLSSGDFFLHKVIAMTPRVADKQRSVKLLHQIESEVSTYLFTVTVINTVLGCAVAAAMYAMDVPNPVLWGVMVGLFNFIPYLGDIVSFGVLTVVGLLTFDEIWRALLVPGVFYVLTAAEGYLIAPLIVGRRLRLNPVVIVLSVLFWGWMWGIFGAILAVPILVVLRSVCAHVEPWHSFGEFLQD